MQGNVNISDVYNASNNMKAYWDDKLKAMLDFIVNFFSYMVVDNEYSYIEEKYTNLIWQNVLRI